MNERKAKSFAECEVSRLVARKGDTHYRFSVDHRHFGWVCDVTVPKDKATVEFAKKVQQAIWCLINLEADEAKKRGVV